MEEESGDFVMEAVGVFDMVVQDEDGIGCGPPGEESTLKKVNKGAGQCRGQEAGGHHPLKNFREGAEEDANSKRGW